MDAVRHMNVHCMILWLSHPYQLRGKYSAVDYLLSACKGRHMYPIEGTLTGRTAHPEFTEVILHQDDQRKTWQKPKTNHRIKKATQ